MFPMAAAAFGRPEDLAAEGLAATHPDEEGQLPTTHLERHPQSTKPAPASLRCSLSVDEKVSAPPTCVAPTCVAPKAQGACLGVDKESVPADCRCW